MKTPTAAVVGQLARDLVLQVGEAPGPGIAADARARLEQLGGKGANQAVALAQLGVRPALVAVAGDDDTGGEAELLLGAPADDPDAIREAATALLAAGPSLVAVALADSNLFVWRDGTVSVPLTDDEVFDTTGGGDAFVAALTAALLSGHGYADAACHAVAASGATVGHAGGRPGLDPGALRERVTLLKKQVAGG